MSLKVADVVIIGGGIIGGLTARQLASRGLRVQLLEANSFGSEASWAAAGMLAPGTDFVKPGLSTTIALRSLPMWSDLAQELQAETGIDIGYRKSGAVEITFNERDTRALEERARLQSAIGIRSEVISRKEVQFLIPRLGDLAFESARYFLDEAQLDPRQTMLAIRKSCERHGVKIFENSPASFVQLEEVVHVMARGEMFVGRAGVLCAGAWSAQIQLPLGSLNDPQSAVYPVKGHLIAYKFNPGLLMPILRNRDTYLLQRTDGTLIAGGTTETKGYDRTVDETVVADIHSRASRVFPTLATYHPREAWSGLRPCTANHEPMIARYSGANLWLAYGHFKNGILMGPGTAKLVSDELVTALETS